MCGRRGRESGNGEEAEFFFSTTKKKKEEVWLLNPGCDRFSWCVEMRIGDTSCNCCGVFFFFSALALLCVS